MSRFQIIPPDDLANDFSDYFVQKIERSNDSPDALQSSEPVLGDDDVSAENTGECADCVLICANVQSSQTSRPWHRTKFLWLLDPTSVVLQILDVLLPVITCMINVSFESGLFAEEWRQALVLPTLKKCGLDIAYKNFRLVSNLPYVSNL